MVKEKKYIYDAGEMLHSSKSVANCVAFSYNMLSKSPSPGLRPLWDDWQKLIMMKKKKLYFPSIKNNLPSYEESRLLARQKYINSVKSLIFPI